MITIRTPKRNQTTDLVTGGNKKGELDMLVTITWAPKNLVINTYL